MAHALLRAASTRVEARLPGAPRKNIRLLQPHSIVPGPGGHVADDDSIAGRESTDDLHERTRLPAVTNRDALRVLTVGFNQEDSRFAIGSRVCGLLEEADIGRLANSNEGIDPDSDGGVPRKRFHDLNLNGDFCTSDALVDAYHLAADNLRRPNLNRSGLPHSQPVGACARQRYSCPDRIC